MIELKKISVTDPNMQTCIELEVFPEQINFVSGNATSLGQAYDLNKRGGCAMPYAIYAEGMMVGFVMYEFLKYEIEKTYGEDCYYFWRFMIDKNHQGKGYGKEVVSKILAEIKQQPFGKANYIYLSYEPKNTVAQKLYATFGFVETGQLVDGEVVARRSI